jgi:DNA repair protein RadA/Sms
MAARPKSTFICSDCSSTYPKWMGKCTECGAFGTVEEKAIETTAPSIVGVKSKGTSTMSNPALRMQDISAESHKHKSTGIGEFDRVLGGGLVKGGVILLAGEPGVGKSSLLAIVAHHISTGGNVLYVSGEESVQQIKIRHQRMKAEGENLFLASENDLSKVIWQIDEVKPELIIVDSVQTIASPDIDGRAGSPSQVTEVATILTRIAKERGIPLIFVGHFTKAGDVAGPRVVEHLVDVVLSFEGESDSPLRLLRGIKNRFGPADEIGCFEHTEEGLEEVADPSGLLLSSRSEPVMGVATSIFLEGKRALPIEVQALVTASVLPNPRKVTSGLDSPKTIQIQAVMEKHGGLRLSDKDVYVSTIGGMKVKETSIDLATVIALASAQLSLISRNDAVAIGEVALSGEIRRTPGINRKLAEALRLGFSVAFVPVGTKAALTPSLASSSLKVIELKNVEHAIGAVRGFAMAHEMGIDTK